MVKIRYWDGTVTFYAHMSSLSVTEGESVVPGQVVGHSGNTGHSTGPHLHLEVHPDGGAAINPVPWLSEHHLSV
jgi:murein DD-endopeptidase MepM/ murein hydrolase activator NlpD